MAESISIDQVGKEYPGGSVALREVSLQVDPETLVLAVIARTAAEQPEEEAEGEVPEAPEAVAEQAADSEGAQAG